jgi:glucose-1-phosphate thymidylyltransferase
MIAILLCAGFATRMYPLTADFPKPLLPVANKPVIDYLIDQIVLLPEIESIHLVTNAKFFDHFVQWRQARLRHQGSDRIEYVIHNDGALTPGNRLGACADLQLAFRRSSCSGPVLVSAADNIYLFGIGDLWKRFLTGKYHSIVALVEDNEEILKRSGIPIFGEENRVKRLLEKPLSPPSSWLCPPLYFFKNSAREVLDRFLESHGFVDAPGHFIDYLCRKEVVNAFKLDGRRMDIGSPKTYRKADRFLRQLAGNKCD